MNMLKKDFADGNLTKKDFIEYCNRFAELHMVEAVMATTRHNWHPTSGTGSQGANWKETVEFHLKMAICGAKAAIEKILYFDEGLDEVSNEEYEKLETWDREAVDEIKHFKKLLKKLAAVDYPKQHVEMERRHSEES